MSPGRVVRSTDDGVTWAPFAAAPPMTGIEAFALAPDGRLNRITVSIPGTIPANLL